MSKQLANIDPDEYRMSLGDHLEELRKRIILALVGVFSAFVLCAIFANDVIQLFCRPLVTVLVEHQINPQLYFTSVGEPFALYLKITMISATVIASPWIIWQIWQFIAAGLYPRERKAVWRYAPLSIALMISGVIFCFWVVLPLCLRFLIEFSSGIPLTVPAHAAAAPTTAPSVMTVPALAGDPSAPTPYQIWLNLSEQRLKFAMPNAVGVLQTVVIPFGQQSLFSPHLSPDDYIDMVLQWLGIFAVAFQLPLVIMALGRMGIVEVADLKKFRRYVYVGLAVLSSMLMPDVFSGTLLLLVPLCLLYELGILLAKKKSVVISQ